MKTSAEIRQIIINILWKYEDLDEYEILKIANEIIAKLQIND